MVPAFPFPESMEGMAMELLTTGRIITLVVFLALLLALWAAVHLQRGALGHRLRAARRLAVVEAVSLGDRERAVLIEVDGARYLVVTARGQAPQLHPLPAATAAPLLHGGAASAGTAAHPATLQGPVAPPAGPTPTGARP
ncbi:flagellar biosynthetic protein FliO [Plastorhodobacter daqingensis]|uniref:Flagellar biosynthetic protein FliO n=1 Tax=Plastorhodobacter daqingensis TaxID=1387281 RepID=A0ABW2UGD9_9RHOB